MSNSTAVTTRQPFDTIDDDALFSVNAGVPVEAVLERAADLMLYAEALSAADAFSNKVLESAIVQTLSEMAKALVNSARQGDGSASA